MCTVGCNGGGKGTSGNGRTPYTPKKNSATMSRGSRTSVNGSSATKDGRASQYGKPAVRASFGRRK